MLKILSLSFLTPDIFMFALIKDFISTFKNNKIIAIMKTTVYKNFMFIFVISGIKLNRRNKKEIIAEEMLKMLSQCLTEREKNFEIKSV